MKIVVLAGGTSSERAVSIVSGTNVCKALRTKEHKAILVDVFAGVTEEMYKKGFSDSYDVDAASEYMKSCNEIVELSKGKRKSFFGPHVLDLLDQADIAFLALHGANGEDGKVQAALDLMGVKYTGTDYLSSAIAMDKEMAKRHFAFKGVPCPTGASIRKDMEKISLEDLGLHYPVIVKPQRGGSSVGCSLAEDDASYKLALAAAFEQEEEILVEEFIKGREFSVAVIDGQAYPIVEIAPKTGFYNYENKYLAGATVETCPAALTEEQTRLMQEYAVKGAEALGIVGYSRLDFMMTEAGDMYCLEANTLPGMTPTSLIPQEAAVLGISYEELCELLIKISLKKYEEK